MRPSDTSASRSVNKHAKFDINTKKVYKKKFYDQK